MIVGIGTDIIEVERVARVCENNARFLARVFSDGEREYSFKNKMSPHMHLAACWSAKESFFKATNFKFRYGDLEVVHDEAGKPSFDFGPALAGEVENLSVHLSISHIKDLAVTTVVVYEDS